MRLRLSFVDEADAVEVYRHGFAVAALLEEVAQPDPPALQLLAFEVEILMVTEPWIVVPLLPVASLLVGLALPSSQLLLLTLLSQRAR